MDIKEKGIKEQGSYEGWNKVWTDETKTGSLNPHYTLQSPTTIYQFWQQGYANDLINLIKDRNYTSFCELGSGRGTTSMYLSNAGYTDITMVDLAEQGFVTAQYSFAHHKLPQPKLVQANVEQTGLPAESFDCIYNIGLLEHFENPAPTMEEAFRLLKPGGLIFMPIVPAMPYRKSIFARLLFNPVSLVKKIVKVAIRYENKAVDNGILRTDYDRNYYIDICKKAGYKNIRCIPYNAYWKVNADGNLEDKITLPLYKKHYNLFKKGNTLSFQTSSLFEFCYLLLAEK